VSERHDTASADDAAIEEFHRAARRRKAIIFGVAAVICVLAGAAALLVALTVDVPDDSARRRYDVRVILLGIVLIGAGLVSAYNAYRIGTGQIADID
jgi:hypothetical protein